MEGADGKAWNISRHLRNRIVAGEFKPGDMLPDSKELCRVHHTTENTITAALAYLVGEGLVVRRRFKGSWVRGGQ